MGNDLILRFLIRPEFRFARHLLLLLGTLLMAVENCYEEFVQQAAFQILFFMIVGFFVPIYANVYWLTPRYLLRKRYISFFLLTGGFSLLAIVSIVFVQLIPEATFERTLEKKVLAHLDMVCINLIAGIISIMLMIAGTSALLLFRHWIVCRERINLLESTTLRAELEQLKNQINPHFLFNMLNNANVLTKEDPQEAACVLLKLSDLLKYQLKDSVADAVRLADDIRFLTDFLNLEKIRRDYFEFRITTKGAVEEVVLPPLLFIPFVENAVKHNLGNQHLSYVHLAFNVDDKQLSFVCINSKAAGNRDTSERGGLGLVNIQRRLQLLYKQDYSLKIDENERTYTVQLHLKL